MPTKSGRALLLLGMALGVGVVGAQPDKQETARSAVKRIGKAFNKLRSYQINASVDVGEATGDDSRIVKSTVSKTYRADVVGRLCQVDSPRAYRPRTDSLSGAIQEGLTYKSMLATEDGRLLGRLFPPVEQLLAEASRFKKTAQWLDAGGQEPADSASADADRDDDERAGTAERDGPDAAEVVASLPHRIRVVGPSTVALEHFITVTNSGCFSEG